MTFDVALSRRLLMCGLVAIPVVGIAGGSLSTRLDRLLALNSRARGGMQRLRRLRTIDTVLRIIEPRFTVTGRYRAARNGMMRIDVFAGGKRAFSEGVDAEGSWSWPGGALVPAPSGVKARLALEHGVVFNLVPLFEVPRLGHRLTLVSADPPCVQLDFADGFQARLFFDPLSSNVVRRQDRRAYHPDSDAKERRIESRSSDFRSLDGVVSPWIGEDYDLDSGQRIGRTETLRLVWDTDISAFLPRGTAIEAPTEAG